MQELHDKKEIVNSIEYHNHTMIEGSVLEGFLDGLTLEKIRNSVAERDLFGEFNKDSLSENQLTLIIQKYFAITTSSELDQSDIFDYDIIFLSNFYGSQQFVDRFFRTVLSAPFITSERLDSFLEALDDTHGQVVSPDTLLDVFQNLIWRPDVDQYIKNSLLFLLEYNFKSSHGYDEVFLRHLDFEHKDNFFATGVFLDYFLMLYQISANSYQVEEITRLVDVLRKLVASNVGSYFLNLKAKLILKSIESSEYLSTNRAESFEWDTSGTLALELDSHIFLSQPESREIILELEKQFQNISKQMQEITIQKGSATEDGYIEYGGPEVRKLSHERKTVGRELVALFPHRLMPSDITPIISESDDIIIQNQQDVFDLEYMLSRPMRQHLKESFNITVEELSPYEKNYFLNFIKSKTSHEIERVQKFTRQYGLSGIRTFLAIQDEGQNMGEIILDLGEKLPYELAQKLFHKYYELIEPVFSLQESLLEVWQGKDQLLPEHIEAIKSKLLARGCGILKDTHALLQQDAQSLDSEALIRIIDASKVENAIFASLTKTLKDSGNPVTFEDIQGLELERYYSTDQLLPEDIKNMQEIYAKNYVGKPELQKVLLEKFKTVIDTGYNYTDFFILKYKGVIVAFCRFDYHPEDREVYFGSFNVNKEFGNGAIGSAMLQATVEENARWWSGLDYVIRAECSAVEPLAAKYIESGFVVTRFFDFFGEPSFEIKRDDLLSPNTFELKGLSHEAILERSERGLLKDSTYIGFYDTQESVEYNLLEYGYVITRYFFDTVQKQWIVGFEKLYRDPFTRERTQE